MEQLLLDIVQNDSSTAWLYHFLFMVLVSMIPFAPIPVLAALIASNHAFFPGLAINMLGSTLGSFLLFLLSKSVLRNAALNYVNKKQQLSKFFALIEKNGFVAVLLARIVPFVPTAAINVIAGISNVRVGAFITATLLGKLPLILAYTLAGHQLAAGNWGTVLIIALYVLTLFLIGMKLKQKWSQ
ncbi:VTT domain-containing protein [Sporosarcina oncorhynchi]|uniref:TVP38/TMEM64 family membrane protein n=1 Tax=Sporosarcina oncorhynchi TaxID=3056444 RepID=A0ABZ0L381_9BACL|nr:VTT domain-containing protein [Sporosarcina sp. T2O-4]WOV86933.1 VTT domain-containing protein [Sporosarcina sp. T2O-4]